MLSFYIFAAVVGGALVALSAFAGSDSGTDTDADVDGGLELDHDVEAELDHEVEAELDHEAEAETHAEIGHAVWLPFLSLRFWTYTLCFLGLTGVLLTALSDLASALVAALSTLTGLSSGFGISYAMRLLKQSQSDSIAGATDIIGAEGIVLLAIRSGQPGKIRCRVKDQDLDLLAHAEGQKEIERGAQVVVVSYEGSEVTVIRKSDWIDMIADRRPKQLAQPAAGPGPAGRG